MPRKTFELSSDLSDEQNTKIYEVLNAAINDLVKALKPITPGHKLHIYIDVDCHKKGRTNED